MRRSVRWTLFASVIAALALVRRRMRRQQQQQRRRQRRRQPRPGRRSRQGKQGGTLTFLAAGDVDYLDPGQTYYTFGYMVQYAVNRTAVLVQARRLGQAGARTSPTGEPEISSDNKTITVHIKKGVKYAPPVNREVKTADIKYAIERAFSKQVPSGYAGAYFSSIVGTPAKPNTRRHQADLGHRDAGRHTRSSSSSRRPSAPLVSQALVMPITDAGAGGVREEVRREARRRSTTSTSPSPARTWSRTTRRPARSTGRVAGQVDRRSSATPTGTSRPTTAPPTSTRSTSRRATTTWPRPRAAR